MSARGWVERLSGARADPATQQPPSRARPGAGSQARSGSPERIPVPPPAPPARPPVPDPKGSALRVVLVSRDNMLAGALRSLIEAPGGIRVLDWYSEELDSAIRHADVVIVDMPPNLHERTFAVIDGRFLGRTVVLLQEGEQAEALPPGPPRAILYRPVQMGELWMAVTGASPPDTTDQPAPGLEQTPDAAPDLVDAESAPSPGPQEREAVAAAEAPAAAQVVGEPPAAPEAVDVEPEIEDQAPVEAVEPEGLPVAESGRLIGLSGQELDPVTGPGQMAPGMDEATLERLRRWGSREQEPPAGRTGPTPATRPAAGREKARQAKAAQAEARRADQAAAGQAKAAGPRPAASSPPGRRRPAPRRGRWRARRLARPRRRKWPHGNRRVRPRQRRLRPNGSPARPGPRRPGRRGRRRPRPAGSPGRPEARRPARPGQRQRGAGPPRRRRRERPRVRDPVRPARLERRRGGGLGPRLGGLRGLCQGLRPVGGLAGWFSPP